MGKKGLISMVIILAVLVVGLGGYIVYDKVLVTTEKSTNQTANEEQNESKENK